MIKMKNLKVNDFVLTANGFEKVSFFLHKDENVFTQFVEITFFDGDENSHNKKLFSKRLIGELSVKKEELYFLQVVLAKNLKMIDGEPEIRREFFNDLMFHVKPETKKLHNAYQKALKQRNRALKKKLSISEVSLWGKELSALGLKLSLEQYNFFKVFKILSKLFQFFSSLSCS